MSGTHRRLLTEYLAGDSWRRRGSFGLHSDRLYKRAIELGDAAGVRGRSFSFPLAGSEYMGSTALYKHIRMG
jgi:hypothetical protein